MIVSEGDVCGGEGDGDVDVCVLRSLSYLNTAVGVSSCDSVVPAF